MVYVFITLVQFIFFTCYFNRVISSSINYDLRIVVIDQSLFQRPIPGAIVTISGKLPVTYVGNNVSLITSQGGYAYISSLPEGIKNITITWKSRYSLEQVRIYNGSINLNKSTDLTIKASVYDVNIKLITPSGKPITGAEVWFGNIVLGLTNTDGNVTATQVPSWYKQGQKEYPVTATWFGADISPGTVNINSTKTYILTASNVGTLTVQVVNAQRQGLGAAKVEIKNTEGITVFSGVTNEQGVVRLDEPYGIYNVIINYKGLMDDASITVNMPVVTVHTVQFNIFIEILGRAMTYTTFIYFLILIIVVIAIGCLSFLVRRY